MLCTHVINTRSLSWLSVSSEHHLRNPAALGHVLDYPHLALESVFPHVLDRPQCWHLGHGCVLHTPDVITTSLLWSYRGEWGG